MTQKARKRRTVKIGESDGERARCGATETVRKSGVKTGEREGEEEREKQERGKGKEAEKREREGSPT